MEGQFDRIKATLTRMNGQIAVLQVLMGLNLTLSVAILVMAAVLFLKLIVS